MAAKRLAICDKEERYMFRLRDYLDKRDSFPFEICTYTDIDILKNDISKGNIELALIDDSFMDMIDSNWKNVIILQTGKRKITGYPLIWKYQSGDLIRKDILRACVDDATDIEEKEELSGSMRVKALAGEKVIGFFSPVHRSLQTSIALVLGQILSKSQKSIYLNFEPFSGFAELKNLEEKQKDITDLIYFIRAGKSKLLYRFESMINTMEGLEYIQPANNFTDLSSISGDDWLELLDEIKRMNRYENIILDLSEMNNGLIDILKKCDLVFSVRKQDYFGRMKTDGFINTLKEYGNEDILRKIIWLDVPIFNRFNPDINKFRNTEIWMYVNDNVVTYLE